MTEHPSKRIVGEFSKELWGKRILLAVTGSVSLYKSLDLARSIMRRGGEVRVIMSRASSRLISPEMFRWATGNPVVTEVTGDLEHITLAEGSDIMVVAPCTSSTLVKIALGLSDSLITLTSLNFISKGKPLVVVPAMHLEMYTSPQVREAIGKLNAMGVEVVPPDLVGDKAHYPSLEFLTSFICTFCLRGKDLKGKRLVVTAGPTREHLDPVRFISNPSSGIMGISIANEASFRGANVTLIKGPTSACYSPYVSRVVQVETTADMAAALDAELSKGADAVILAAAPADFKFDSTYDLKVDSHSELPKVQLVPTEKVSKVARKYDVLVIGFSAETAKDDLELVERAKRKKEIHGFDIVVANNVARRDIGFSSRYNEVVIIGNGWVKNVSKSPKEVVARHIVDQVKEELKSRAK